MVTADEAGAWADHTTGAFTLHVHHGNHFYLLQQWHSICRIISERLGDSLGRR